MPSRPSPSFLKEPTLNFTAFFFISECLATLNDSEADSFDLLSLAVHLVLPFKFEEAS